MKINRIIGTNMELTEVIKDYVNEKIGSLDKYWDRIIDADVEVGLIGKHHQSGEIYRCEVNLRVPGKILRAEKTEKDLYKAIDKVKDHLQEIIEEHQGKMETKRRKGARMRKDIQSLSPLAMEPKEKDVRLDHQEQEDA
ncbi:ribosome-associated translation inhibitor RaiA [Patescibacteria group bacterium]|nr:ribosome-associated translation inhibitor RaiA [Patescibacteria group bacterium]MBU1922217.1 ribosome-associated translation inhibitor RaiA [Patescibacteria group bacterium]